MPLMRPLDPAFPIDRQIALETGPVVLVNEEWKLEPRNLSVEALVGLPNGMAMVVGLATVADSSEPVPDAEHDEWEWWDPDPDRWPEHADDRVRLMGRLLAAA